MSDEINQLIDSFINQEQRLLAQLDQIQRQKKNIGTQLTKEAASLLAREYFGRTGGKVVRSLVEQGEKERFNLLQEEVDRQHRIIVSRIHALLSKVSEWNKNLKEPNSLRLLSRLDKAQEGVRVITRIMATVKLLTGLKVKHLVYNTDIPIIEPKEVVLPPRSPFTGLMELRRVLSSATGYVKICDTYVDVKTLDILNSIPPSIPIQLLTENTGGSKRAPAFLRACKDFKVEHPMFEVKKGKELHDRFILMENRGWSVGPSLKDFGNKFSALTPLQQKGRQDAEKIFDNLWKKARTLII